MLVKQNCFFFNILKFDEEKNYINLQNLLKTRQRDRPIETFVKNLKKL